MSKLELQLRGYRLTLAEITYRMPDYPSLLQKYIWQDLDIAPGYPVLRKFLDFWERNLDGGIHSVRIASKSLIRPPQMRWISVPLSVH